MSKTERLAMMIVGGLLTIGCCVVIGILGATFFSTSQQAAIPPPKPAEVAVQTAPTATPQPTATPTSTIFFVPSPTSTPTATRVVPPTKTPTPKSGAGTDAIAGSPGLVEAQVVGVVDGDTIDVVINGRQYRIRYILVDTPEVSGGVEPFGLEATEANRQLVEGKTVLLEKDVSETDRYGRLLRYVYVGELMVNEELLRRGMATVATFPPDVKYVDRFRAVEAEARAAGVGLWAEQARPEPDGTPVPAQPSSGSLVIVDVNKHDEYVDVRNDSLSPVALAGWRLLSERGNQDCALGGSIEPGSNVAHLGQERGRRPGRFQLWLWQQHLEQFRERCCYLV